MKPEKQYEFSDVINLSVVQQIAQSIQQVWKPFDAVGFEEAIAPTLSTLAFKERANLIATAMYDFLPKDFGQTGQLLLDSFGSELTSLDFSGASVFMYMPHGVYVSRYGLEEAHFELAATFLYEMTKRFSAEFAIRPFLAKYPKRMLEKLVQWVRDDNQHVRRLVSEGTRPRLPWAARVTAFDADYSVIINLLEQLKNDPELYVRRSVANHLNDLTKDREELVVDTLQTWNQKPTQYITWITKHALRTLVKARNTQALALLGFSNQPAIEVADFKLNTKQLQLGEELHFSFDVVSKSNAVQPLMVDYILHYKKANGKQAPKVFKLKIVDLKPQQTLSLKKKQRFQHLSTRLLYAGLHKVELQINGQRFGEEAFELVF